MMTQNRTNAFVILLAGMLASLSMAGCGARISVMNKGDADRGLIIVLPGIDGRARHNERVCKSFGSNVTGMGVELFDWTLPLCPMTNQRDEGRNRRMAGGLADRIVAYRANHPCSGPRSSWVRFEGGLSPV